MSESAASSTARVLIVEDSDSIRILVSDYLGDKGYSVRGVSTLAAARTALAESLPDIIILDLGLDDGDGTELMRDLKELRLPCIVISSRSDINDRLQLLELGADDYLIKPIDLQELYLRVRNMLAKRPRPTAAGDEVIVTYHGIRVVLATRAVIDSTGKILATLSDSELQLIRTLSQSFGNVVSRKDLYTSVFDRKSFEGSRALDVLVSKLRRKLREIGVAIDVKSVRGAGYMMLSDAREE